MSVVNINQQLCFRPTAEKPKAILNIDKWTSAFFVFTSIFLEKHPQRAVEMIKYTDLIRKLAFRFGGFGWVNYDREFRLEQAQNPARSWATYDGDLFLEKLAMPVFSNQRQNFRGQSSRFPHSRAGFPSQLSQSQNSKAGFQNREGVCFAFNKQRKCFRKACKWAHKCSICFQPTHPASACTQKQVSRQNTNLNHTGPWQTQHGNKASSTLPGSHSHQM